MGWSCRSWLLQHSTGRLTQRPLSPADQPACRRSVLGQDLVQLLAGLLNHADAPLDLRLLTGAGQLLGGAHELPHAQAECAYLVVGLGAFLPGELGFLGLGPS